MKVTLITNTPEPQRLIETCARISYDSKNDPFDPEVNSKFIRKLISMGHDSPLEHASATFLIEGISRACSHQIVRHRLASFSQRSGRYTKFTPDEGCFVDPPSFKSVGPDITILRNRALSSAHDCYEAMLASGVPKEDARFILPQAEATSLYMTANFREWHHFLRLRLDRHAQWEIQRVAQMVLAILLNIAPDCFHDIACSFLGLDVGTSSETVNTEMTKYVVDNIPDVRKELVDNAVRDVTKSMDVHDEFRRKNHQDFNVGKEDTVPKHPLFDNKIYDAMSGYVSTFGMEDVITKLKVKIREGDWYALAEFIDENEKSCPGLRLIACAGFEYIGEPNPIADEQYWCPEDKEDELCSWFDHLLDNSRVYDNIQAMQK